MRRLTHRRRIALDCQALDLGPRTTRDIGGLEVLADERARHLDAVLG
jgi:hypothetical protein